MGRHNLGRCHPFPDGNGRTGRSLVHALLRAKRVTRNVTVPVSAGLLTNVESYFDALTTYRRGDPGAIVARFAEAAFRAVGNGRQLVSDLRGTRDAWEERIRARRDATEWKIADLLVRQPVIDSPMVQRELGVSATNVNKAIDRLVDRGVLQKVSATSGTVDGPRPRHSRPWTPSPSGPHAGPPVADLPPLTIMTTNQRTATTRRRSAAGARRGSVGWWSALADDRTPERERSPRRVHNGVMGARQGSDSSTRRAIAGGLAGSGATVVMSAFMWAAQRLGVMGEQPPRRITRGTLRRGGVRPRDGDTERALSSAAHLGFGATSGALYAVVAPRTLRGWRRLGLGVGYGLTVWAVGYKGLLPAARLMPEPEHDRPGRPTAMIAAHVVYGAALAALLRRERPRSALLGGQAG
ncbi:MAG: Fic family protein [Euzebyales bacterium]|nr:Fic family protein [Euzebyales bacterium]